MLTRTLCPRIRQFHTSAIRAHLVGPSDPVSNLRPVIYDDAVPEQSAVITHPYSLKEFAGDTREYQWKIQRQQLDAYNHWFWTDNNLRFNAAKQAVLESLSEICSEEDREFALSQFYGLWLEQEADRQRDYSAEWRKRNLSSIVLGARLLYNKAAAYMAHPFGRSNEHRNE